LNAFKKLLEKEEKLRHALSNAQVIITFDENDKSYYRLGDRLIASNADSENGKFEWHDYRGDDIGKAIEVHIELLEQIIVRRLFIRTVFASMNQAIDTFGITVRESEDKVEYLIGELVEAEYHRSSGNVIWRTGNSVKEQDAVIRAHIALYPSAKKGLL
jgi:hypothetical protein